MITFPSGVIPPTPGQVPSFGAIGASLHTEVNIFNTCTHCLDSYRSRWSGMASHSLLQRRFAPRKVVRLPSLFPVLFYIAIPGRLLRPFKNDRQVFNTVEKQNPPLPNSHHSRTFFTTLSVTAFYLHLRMPGKYVIPLKNASLLPNSHHSRTF